MPCQVTANLIEVLSDGSVRVSGVFNGSVGFSVSVSNLTVRKTATLVAPNWSVVFSGAEITGNLTQFRNNCGGEAEYEVSRAITGFGTEIDFCRDVANALVQCERREECPNVTGTANVGDDCDADRNRLVDFALTFDPPIPQGAFAQVFWSFGGPNAQGQLTATDTLPTTSGPVTQHNRSTLMPPRPPSGQPNACSYFASAVVTVVVDGEPCTLVPVVFCLVVDSCLPCPGNPARNRPPVTLRITTPNNWCAPPQAGQEATFTAAVNFLDGTPSPPVPSEFDWAVRTPGGEIFLRETNVGSATTANGWRLNGAGAPTRVDLSQPGDFAVSVAVKFPPSAGLPTGPDGTPSCNVTASSSFRLDLCEGTGTCPSIIAINVTPDCADPAAGLAANVSFSVSTNDPSGLISGFVWNFGDPASGGANRAETTTPNATHSYAGTGNFTVTVRANIRAACDGGGPTTATTFVGVPLCPCPPGQTRDARGRCVETPPPQPEDCGCLLLRELVAGLAALAIVTLMIAFCLFIPGAPPFLIAIGIAAGLAVAAAILLLIWSALPCPRPCAWALLLLAQIFIGAGWGTMYFFFCCWWMGGVALGMLGLGGVLLFLWINVCRPTFCRVFRELAWVLTVVVAPVVAFILLYAPAAACAIGFLPARVVNAILTLLVAVIVAIALACTDE